MLVLHVEDDDLKARAIGRIVLGLTVGVDYGRESTLDEALARIEDERPDAVITDWSFPVAPGSGEVSGMGAAIVDLCERLAIPVLVVSGSDRPASVRCAWAGADWLGAIKALLDSAGIPRGEAA